MGLGGGWVEWGMAGGPFCLAGKMVDCAMISLPQACFREGHDVCWPTENGSAVIEEMSWVDDFEDGVIKVWWDCRVLFVGLWVAVPEW